MGLRQHSSSVHRDSFFYDNINFILCKLIFACVILDKISVSIRLILEYPHKD